MLLCLFSYSQAKDEPPDMWDEDEQEEDKEKLRIPDKDAEFLLQEIVRDRSLDDYLKSDLESKKSDMKYKEMLELVELINSNRVLVVSGETGCGKTTQVTQFILDDYINRGVGSTCRIVCTQPRRISAISVAERVAAERAESVGNGNSCGYQIRLQSRLPRRQGSVLYCTTGIILQWLRSDPLLSSISHLVLDEIHERNLQSDVLLIIVKDLLHMRDDLKVILMSATLNAEKFSQYFDNCPMIHIPGLTFPVKEFFLEDVVEMTRYQPQNRDRRSSWKRGFWQGHNSRPEKEVKEAEYREMWPCFARTLEGRYSHTTIEALEKLDNDDKIDLELIMALIHHIVREDEDYFASFFVISALHQSFPSAHTFPAVNKKKYKMLPVVSSLLLEMSVPSCSETAASFVKKNFPLFFMYRVRPGKCYHLYNNLRASLLDDYQLPEIMRTPLEELCLQIKILKLGSIARFLEKALDPPTEKAVNLSIKNLTDLNALDHAENLTALGIHLARLPVEPHIGKLILFGALLGCLDPVLTIAASLSFKDPFFIPLGKEKMADMKRKVLSRNSKSDHLTIVNAFQGWEDAKQRGARYEREYCWDNFLSANTLQMLHNMKGQFAEHLMHAGFVSSKDPKDPKSNVNSDNDKLIKAVIVAGLYPKVAMIRPCHSKKRVKVYTQADGKVCIHPKSVNSEETEFNYTWLIYHLKMRTTSIFLYDCTEVSPFSLLFFGGDITIQRDEDQETIAVDQWIVFRSPARIAHLVKSLKKELDSLLEEKIRNPAPVDWQNRQSKDCAVITAIIDLITTQEKSTGTSRSYGEKGSYIRALKLFY
uniref:RNA helicase n=1 Tax=Sphaeramia orbicularis TaxID=375764 RepID=A0A672YPY7_9TELE